MKAKAKPGPKAYIIRDNLVIDRKSGAYRFSVETEGLKRYTAYVQYGDPNADYSIEEIDVDAHDLGEAHDVAARARDAEYEEGGLIVLVEERFGWYL